MNPVDVAVSRLTAVYGEPKTPDPELFVDEFRKALKGTDPHLLAKALDNWIKSDTAFWPRPGEILAEVRKCAADAYTERRYHVASERPPPSPEAAARVRALVDDAKRAMTATDLDRDHGHREVDWEKGQRDGFEQMQSESPNSFHRVPGLTPISKRMTGERE